MAMNRVGRLIGSIVVPAAGAVGASNVYGGMLPFDTYLDSDMGNIHEVLDDMDGVDMNPNALYSQPGGSIEFQDSTPVHSGVEFWVITQNDKQVVGKCLVDVLGGYNFSIWGPTFGIYGDKLSTPTVDEGAGNLEPLIIAASIAGVYKRGTFTTTPLSDGYALTDSMDGADNITITYEIIGPIPIPSTLHILLVGAGLAGLRRPKHQPLELTDKPFSLDQYGDHPFGSVE